MLTGRRFHAALRRLKAQEAEVLGHRIIKSVDARDKAKIQLVYTLELSLAGDEAAHLEPPSKGRGAAGSPHKLGALAKEQPLLCPRWRVLAHAGCSAALAPAKAGLNPLVLERGAGLPAQGD